MLKSYELKIKNVEGNYQELIEYYLLEKDKFKNEMKSRVIESLTSKFTTDKLNENLKLLEYENSGFKNLIAEYKILIENCITQKGLLLFY